MHWELIRDLAWLASQKKVRPDERTVRRYLDEATDMKNPALDFGFPPGQQSSVIGAWILLTGVTSSRLSAT